MLDGDVTVWITAVAATVAAVAAVVAGIFAAGRSTSKATN